MNKQQIITTSIVGLFLYFIATGLSFSVFRFMQTKSGLHLPSFFNKGGTSPQKGFLIDKSAPKTEVCPINGAYFTKQEKEVWSTRRPLAVMIENHVEARPQSGLSSADVIYEAVAEGGISRFMGIFYCGVAEPLNLAPVRSARTYYLPWVLEYDALYNHVGGAGKCNDPTVDERAKALCQIDQYKIKDMDQFGISFPTCYRNYDRLDHTVATEHTMVCVTDKLYDIATDRGWTNKDELGVAWDKNFVPWKFKDDGKQGERGASSSASFVPWEGYEKDFGVRWDYDPLLNSYKRMNGGKPHIDLETNEQLTAKVVIIMFAKEIGPVDGHAHLLYENIGSGKGKLLQDGKIVDITWKKADKNARTKFFDTSGKEVSFNRGQIWIEMLPIGRPVQ